MKTSFHLPFVLELEKRLGTSQPLIQVVLGPRQVGKTTGVLQLQDKKKALIHYISADEQLTPSALWLEEQYQKALLAPKIKIFIIDEIQKVPQWSETIKKLWDRQKRSSKKFLKIILLGSSSLTLQKGLTESLAGRFELIRVFQWSYQESKQCFGMDFETYLKFGGYPGSYEFLSNPERWLTYLKSSIVETAIGRDILLFSQVRAPALFRQAFEILCSYPAQEISYNKLLGQLQDKGNTDLIKHYIELYQGAFLIQTLHKFAQKVVLKKTSSPKIFPGCPALTHLTESIKSWEEKRGRLFELVVGNELQRLGGELSYWREEKNEIDYILVWQNNIFAIEVKSGRKKSPKGLELFLKKFSKAKPVFITTENFETFSRDPKAFLKKI